MSTAVAVDPFDVATSEGERQPHYWGKVEVSAQFVTLRKGEGKQPFNPAVDPVEDRRTEVDFIFNPIDAMNLATMLQRQVIAESPAWKRVVWPSLRALGCKSAREVDGKFAKLELAKTGRTWTDRSGGIREETTFRFLAMFNSEAECVADFHKARGGKPEPTEDDPAGDVDMSPTVPTTDGSVGTEAERQTALEFLPFFVKQANGNKAALAQAIAGQEMIARYFTIDSPEVQALAAFK